MCACVVDLSRCRLELMSRWAPFNLQFTVPEEPSSFGTSERDTNQGEDPKTVLIQWQWWLCTAHALARRQTLSSRSVLEIYNVRLIPARGRVAFEVPSFDSRGVVWWRFSGNPTTDAKNQAKKRAVLQKMGMEGNAADLNSTSSRSLANSQGTSSSQAGPRVGFSVLFRPFSEAEGWKPASATSIGKHLRAGDRSSTRLPTSFEGIYDSDSDDPFEHNLVRLCVQLCICWAVVQAVPALRSRLLFCASMFQGAYNGSGFVSFRNQTAANFLRKAFAEPFAHGGGVPAHGAGSGCHALWFRMRPGRARSLRTRV